ncbi:MAG: hypothetical protein C7B45_02950 [Sulfobacillus acidophilus]|uniref:Thioredoxin domain-containing protein n=1 Tax=Sulfobacillus acidophilus TaxID=53633 RepID=A0A2T2WMQ0_9FIRM|nr:MAG: hypothetical protein C7B45_02950 [Sulfobacillus acidophilus]
MAKTSKRNFSQSRSSNWWLWVIVGVLAIGVLIVGYGGLGVRHSASSDSTAAALHEPKLPKNGFTWNYRAYSIKTGRPAYLTRGSRVTVVMLMASWCLYCAYEDRYVWPALIHTPGLQVNLIDVSTISGIGDPGPKTPPFSGHDNQGHAIGAVGMRQTMEKYVKKFHLTEPNVHVFVDPSGIKYWSLQDFPTIMVLNRQGQLVKRFNGALTIAQARAYVQSIAKSSH